jgi:L-methionine (R)-S-oxide reductase
VRDKAERFHSLLGEAQTILDTALGKTEKLQATCQLLSDAVPYYDWVGFYLVDAPKSELVLGPYVGEPTEHVRIPFGQGICGQAADRKATFTVQDVSKATNYLSCSPNVRSEIVVPILKDGEIVGELDIDSHELSPFEPQDVALLERICEMVSRQF